VRTFFRLSHPAKKCVDIIGWLRPQLFSIPRGHFPHLELQSAVRSQYQPLQLDCESHGPHPSKRAALVGSVRSHRTQPSSKSAIVGLGFADQRRQALAQVGRQTSCRSHDRPCRHRLGRCPCAFRHHSQPGGDFFAKMLLSGGPHRSTRAELPMSPEISPKEICQTVFG